MTRRIKSIAEFHQVFENIVTMQLEKARLENRLAVKMLDLKLELEPDIVDLRNKMQVAVLRAEKYWTAHREELQKTAETSVTTYFAALTLAIVTRRAAKRNAERERARCEAVKAEIEALSAQLFTHTKGNCYDDEN